MRETELDLDMLAQSESVFALSNGHIGLRGNLDEGEPYGLPGTYLNCVLRAAPAALRRGAATATRSRARRSSTSPTASSSGCSSTTSRSTSATASCARTSASLDLRAGVLRRRVEWALAGRARRAGHARRGWSRSCSARVAAIDLRGRAARRGRCASSSSPSSSPTSRCRPAQRRPARGRGAGARRSVARSSSTATARVVLVHRTAAQRPADGRGDGPRHRRAATAPTRAVRERPGPRPRHGRRPTSSPGERLRVVKFLAYGWSSQRSLPAAARPGRRRAGRGAARPAGTGWSRDQREYLDDFWDGADVEIDGDAELQQAVRFALFHALQAGARAEQRAIAAKGLTGPGYDGHAFWDTETLRAAGAHLHRARGRRATRCAGGTRRSTSRRSGPRSSACAARRSRGGRSAARNARATGRPGPPRSTSTPTSPTPSSATSTPTGDEDFEREVGLELLVETARLWRSLGHHDAEGRFRIDGVTGPDEYSAIADNNVYTNLMAQRNLRAAADAVAAPSPARRRARRRRRGEPRAGATRPHDMVIPYDEELGVHPQSEGFTEHQRVGLRRTPSPTSTRCCCTSRTSTSTASRSSSRPTSCSRCTCAATRSATRRRPATSPTTRRSPSATPRSRRAPRRSIAAEVGHLDLAYDYLGEAALIDLRRPRAQHPRRRCTSPRSPAPGSPPSPGSAACATTTATSRSRPGCRPGSSGSPSASSSAAARLKVEFASARRPTRCSRAAALITHHGDRVEIPADAALTKPIPAAPVRAAPTQPTGREPGRRKS